MPIVYKGKFGKRNKQAVGKFVTMVRSKVSLPVSPKAFLSASEGVVVRFGFIAGGTNQDERVARRVMANASAEILNKHGVWIVGVPSANKKQTLSPAREHGINP